MSVMFHLAGKGPKQQTDPPSIPVAQLFPQGIFPEGERQSYNNEYVSLPIEVHDKNAVMSPVVFIRVNLGRLWLDMF